MSVADKIFTLTKQLFPTGRAFKISPDKISRALAITQAQAYNAALSILDSALPDNTNFTPGDAKDWEHRLGLITNEFVSLDLRKQAIIRKMNHPGTIPARNNWRFLQNQLQAAGFGAFVYENRFDDGMGGYNTQSPEALSGVVSSVKQYGQFQYGQAQYGGGNRSLVANHINEEIDFAFNVGSNLRSTFFIGGNPIGTSANIDIQRKDEFRQLILRVKPVQSIAFLFVNYTPDIDADPVYDLSYDESYG